VALRKPVYVPYHNQVYVNAKNSDKLLEEALANADCYHRIVTNPYAGWLSKHVVKATRAYLEWQFPHDPPGYRKAEDYLNKQEFDAGENLLQAQVKEVSLTPVQPVDEWQMAPRMTQSFFLVTSNIWTVIPAGGTSRLPTRPVHPIPPPVP
jgi:hypothetical protein